MPDMRSIMNIIGMMRSGNPMQVLQGMAGRDPQIGQVMNMFRGKSPEQLRSMCENMCRERGTTPEEVAKSLGLM